MSSEEKEFLISQYADGGLTGEDAERARQLLATDPDARQLLADFQQLATALRQPPNVNYNDLADSISAYIDEEEQAAREKVYRLPVGAWATGLVAMAACLAIGFFIWRGGGEAVNPRGTSIVATGPRTLSITGPAAESSSGGRVLQVAMSAPIASGGSMSLIPDEVVTSAVTRVMVAAGPAVSKVDPWEMR